MCDVCGRPALPEDEQIVNMNTRYGGVFPPKTKSATEAAFGPDEKDLPFIHKPPLGGKSPVDSYHAGVAVGIIKGRKQAYEWVETALKTLMPLLRLEYPAKTLLQGFMYQLNKFSKTGRFPSNESEDE